MSCENEDCKLIQNEKLLLDKIPNSLKYLPYGIYPDDCSYNNKRFIYNKLFNVFPLAIYYVNSKYDITSLVKRFIFYKTQFTIRCGGHSYEPSSLSNKYIIDVKNINNININTKNKTVKIGSGVKLGHLVNKLTKYHLITPTGDNSCVGISGLSLAGGKGYLTRLYGMTCDNILSLKIVNSNGKRIYIDKDNYPDLFWAFKGAGICNFGVVYEIELQLYEDVYFQKESLTWEWNPTIIYAVLSLYQLWVKFTPKCITTNINITYNNGAVNFTINFYKFSSNNEKEEFCEINEFRNLHCPNNCCTEGYYSQMSNCWLSTNTGESQPFSKMKSTMIFEPSLNEEYINYYINSMDELLKSGLNITFQYNFTQMGGDVENGVSSYYPKKASIALTMYCTWEIQDLTDYCKTFIRKWYDRIIKYTSDYVFPNMIDYDLNDYMNSYYGDNSSKLIEIKNKYDPNNIFHWRQSIPLKSEKNK